MPYGCPFAAARGQAKQLHGWIGTGESCDNCGGCIGAAIINHEQFMTAFVRSEIVCNLLKVRKDAPGFVMGRDDDGKLWGVWMVRSGHGCPTFPEGRAATSKTHLR